MSEQQKPIEALQAQDPSRAELEEFVQLQEQQRMTEVAGIYNFETGKREIIQQLTELKQEVLALDYDLYKADSTTFQKSLIAIEARLVNIAGQMEIYEAQVARYFPYYPEAENKMGQLWLAITKQNISLMRSGNKARQAENQLTDIMKNHLAQLSSLVEATKNNHKNWIRQENVALLNQDTEGNKLLKERQKTIGDYQTLNAIRLRLAGDSSKKQLQDTVEFSTVTKILKDYKHLAVDIPQLGRTTVDRALLVPLDLLGQQLKSIDVQLNQILARIKNQNK